MAVYAISFHIHKNETYDARYKSVTELIESLSPRMVWRETTSFYLIRSNLAVAEIAQEIHSETKLDAEIDLVAVFDVTGCAWALAGFNADDDFSKLMSSS